MTFAILSWLVQATVKGAAAILAVALAEAVVRRHARAAWRHALWLAVALRLVIPIAPQSRWSLFNLVPIHAGIQMQLRGSAAQITFGQNAVVQVPWWIAEWRLLLAIWIGGMMMVVARALLATIRMRDVVRTATDAGATARAIAEEGRRQLGIRRAVAVVESPRIAVPALHGVTRPALVLPHGIAATFERDELRHVILHELAHLRRHDVLVNWLVTIVRAIHWFNPLVWLAAAHIDEERELACDELALSGLRRDERLGYGRTILKLLERFRAAEATPALVGMVGQKERMKRRLSMIGAPQRHSRLALPLTAVLAAVVFATLTDARSGSASAGTLDPVSARTLDKLAAPVSVDVRNASLRQLLDDVGAQSGVALRGPANDDARFTLRVRNEPARDVLATALLPHHLVAVPAGDGMTITRAPACMLRRGNCARAAPR